jgi:prepilin-type N-terminal cleavage/methylation domain-containing protein
MQSIKIQAHQRGFALIELAVVLLILSVLLGLGLSAINAQRTKAEYEKTFAHGDAIKTALVNYLRANKRLPCPSNVGNDGAEAKAGGACNPNVVAGVSNFGIVPWRTLGLERSDALDGWDTYFSYMVSDTAGASDWIAAAGIGSTAIGALTKRETDPAAAPATIDTGNYAVAIISHGPNTRGGFTEKLIANSAAGATIEENDNLGATANRFFAGVPTPNFDDVVVGITATELTGRLISDGVDPTGATRDLVRSIFDHAVGDTLANKSAGNPADCTSGTTPCYVYGVTYLGGVINDSWGRLITVTAAGQLAQVSTPPSTTTAGIAVKSLGPDGIDNACGIGSDDVCRSVSAAELRGILARASGFN